MNQTKLSWADFHALAIWMAEEISGNYIMDKKSYKKPQPPNLPYLPYRQPIRLYHEERAILALFIRRFFWHFWRTGTTNGFYWRQNLIHILSRAGMSDYKNSVYLNTLCCQVTKNLPKFIESIIGEEK